MYFLELLNKKMTQRGKGYGMRYNKATRSPVTARSLPITNRNFMGLLTVALCVREFTPSRIYIRVVKGINNQRKKGALKMSEQAKKLLKQLTYKNELTNEQMQDLYNYFECGYEIFEFLIEKYEDDIFEFPCGYLKNENVTICIFYTIQDSILTLTNVSIDIIK